MRLEEFESRARAVWNDIPDEYKAGIDGLIVERNAIARDQPDVYTLGECLTQQYPSAYGGPDTIRSAVVLYYGSFQQVARGAAQFDWEAEIHETIMHELKHHLEALADEDALGDYDYAVDQNFRRLDGEPFDPWFYRAGEVVADELFLVDGDLFLELTTETRAALPVEVEWEDTSYRVELPAAQSDVTYVFVEGGPEPEGDFYVVRLLRRGTLETLRHGFSDTAPTIGEVSVRAEEVK